MEYLEFSGKKYVKVSSAARETGYTGDYIGQLCRARKIDAKLVGRTWYVAQDEIHSHRRTKGRSAQSKARENLKQQIETSRQEVSIPVRISHTAPSRHRRLLETPVSYHRDDSELIPLAPSATHVPVTSSDRETNISIDADEHHVEVAKEASEPSHATFAPEHKTEVKWNGTIVVEPLEKEVGAPSGPDVTPSERHIRIRMGNERNIKPNLVISDVSNDPLVTKRRFLERMNLAHPLNVVTLHDAPREVSRPVESPIEPTDTRAFDKGSDQETEEVAARVLERSVPDAKSPVVRSHGVTSRIARLSTASLAVVSVCFLLLTAFVQTEAEYRAPSGSGAKPVYLSSVRIASPERTLELLSESVNGALVMLPGLRAE